MSLTEQEFLAEVAHHQMTIVQDTGIHRHLRFRNPADSEAHFELITWPGYLCYTGDMGTFVFQRVTDMFEFFKSARQRANRTGNPISFDYRYWAEKLEAGKSESKAYSVGKFKNIVNEYMTEASFSAAARQEVEDTVFEEAEMGQELAMRALSEFSFEGAKFNEVDDLDPREFTHHFVWCCFALAWSIEKYTQSKEYRESIGLDTQVTPH
ncbi:MAG: hypothetical protein Q7S87_08625 [Agitococcus sp.]|nr:hypothetical protein [Agitococcus sp.]